MVGVCAAAQALPTILCQHAQQHCVAGRAGIILVEHNVASRYFWDQSQNRHVYIVLRPCESVWSVRFGTFMVTFCCPVGTSF